MVLIDSSTDLMATASRANPTSYYQDYYATNEDSWLNNYLEGAYVKRVQDLEQFARDKTLDYLAAEPKVEESEENSELKKRRQRLPHPNLRRYQRPQRRPLRHRNPQTSQRRQEFEEEKVGIYDYVDPLSYSDIYGSPSIINEEKLQQPSLIRRVATSIFNPFSTTIFTVIAVPLMIAAAYWLFVVNGPTPVVKARIEDFEDISTNSVEQEEFSNTDQYEFINQELLINLLKLFVPVVQQES